MKLKSHKRNEKGITLIALVITIIVMLILVAVTIDLAVDGKLFDYARDSKAQYEELQKQEQEVMNVYFGKKETDDSIEEGPQLAVQIGEIATETTTINGEEATATNPPIPKGYIPINTATAKWDDPDFGGAEYGLVITDEVDEHGNSIGNEYVWVQVPDINAICNVSNQTAYTLKGTSGSTAVKTKLYSKSGIISGINRMQPGLTYHFAEPDLVIRENKENSTLPDSDALEAYYKNVLGFNSVEEMAQAMVDSYARMIASVQKYGGFYIGRYEMSNKGCKKDQPSIVNTTWYNLYNKCKNLKANDSVETQMIWGCQWDIACYFIANYGEKKSIEDSTSWGNYKNSVSPANEGNYEQNARKNTGSNEAWKANNIYDLAGNCTEWTQEAYLDTQRMCRGGNYFSGVGATDAAKDFRCLQPIGSPNDYVCSRATLIIIED